MTPPPDYTIHPMKRWVGRLAKNSVIPQSACPTCHAPSTQFTGVGLLTFTCKRGHAWQQTHARATEHAAWIARYTSGQQDQNR